MFKKIKLVIAIITWILVAVVAIQAWPVTLCVFCYFFVRRLSDKKAKRA